MLDYYLAGVEEADWVLKTSCRRAVEAVADFLVAVVLN